MMKNNLQPTTYNPQPKSGFTLIELILYIALLSIFVTGAVLFSLDVVYGREKAFQQQVVEQSSRSTLARIAYEIRRAEKVNSLSATSITLENGANDTTISLVAGQVQITTEGVGPYNLTSNQVYVDNLTFSDESSNANSKTIGISVTSRQAVAAVPGQFQADITISESVDLNGQFNQSRMLLVNTTQADLSPNEKSMEGIVLSNVGNQDVIIESIDFDWIPDGGENLTEIQIDAGAVEWSGSLTSGSLVDITDQTISAGASEDLDYIEFDSKVDGLTFNITFNLSDGSTKKVLISFGVTVTGTPTPTPSPTPTLTPTPGATNTPTPTPTPGVTTCSQYCQGLSYSGGTCRQNAAKCGQSGETYESGGNTYCTGGANADTCCCAP